MPHSYFRLALALRLACIICVVMVHCQDEAAAAAPGEETAAGEEAANAGAETGASSADANAAVGSTSTERAHNIGILIGIIFGSVAVNIVTVFLIVYCLRGKGGGGKADVTSPSMAAMSKRKSSERKSRYDELKDDYELVDQPRESTRMSERRSSARGSRMSGAGSRVSATSVTEVGEEDARRSSARGSAYADEDEASSPGDEKKSSIFSRISGSIKDRMSGADDVRRSSARGSSYAGADDERRSSARMSAVGSDERRSSARMSGRTSGYADEEGGERRSSARASEGGERRSSARASEGGERRSSARASRGSEGGFDERRSSTRKSLAK